MMTDCKGLPWAQFSSLSTVAWLRCYHMHGTLEVGLKAYLHPRHQHCTDEAQKAETVPYAVSTIIVCVKAAKFEIKRHFFPYILIFCCIKQIHCAHYVCYFFVLSIFWRHLWSITEPTHGNMESIWSISNGNRTSCRPIRSVIIRVIKSDDRAAGVRFVYHAYDYRPNWTTRSPIAN